MVELRQQAGGMCALGYGGDTLNTAIHMARLGCAVDYVTALGEDPFSRKLEADWSAEGVDCSRVLTDPVRGAGLYAITLDSSGERSFTYWRSDSAARRVFALPESEALVKSLKDTPALAFSLISLAILPDEGRETLISLARTIRDNGGLVAFDGNYRPLLWQDAATATHWRDRAIAVATIGLPTLDDEIAMTGDTTEDEVAWQWEALGCEETVVKLGQHGCRLPGGNRVAPRTRLEPIDTSGAGDAFNAGYLAARSGGANPAEAARKGNTLAGWAIMRPGAIPARDAEAPYRAAN